MSHPVKDGATRAIDPRGEGVRAPALTHRFGEQILSHGPDDVQIICARSRRNFCTDENSALGHGAARMQVLILALDDHKRQVGHNLRAVIDALEISQVQAARMMGLDGPDARSKVGNWLRGDNYPAPYAVYRFCRATGVTTDWIYLADPSGLPARIRDRLLSAAMEPAVASEPAHPAAGKRPRATAK